MHLSLVHHLDHPSFLDQTCLPFLHLGLNALDLIKLKHLNYLTYLEVLLQTQLFIQEHLIISFDYCLLDQSCCPYQVDLFFNSTDCCKTWSCCLQTFLLKIHHRRCSMIVLFLQFWLLRQLLSYLERTALDLFLLIDFLLLV